MKAQRVLILSPSNISSDPRVLRHIKVAKEFGEVVTCGYGSLPDDVTEHFEISSDARFLPRSFISLVAIQLGMYGFAARRAQFYRQASSALRNQTFDVVIANDVHSIQTAIDLFSPSIIWVDMHEYAPLESEHDWRWRVAFRRFIRHQCSEHLRKVAAVSSVGVKICQRYEEDLGRPVRLIRNASSYIDREERKHEKSSKIRCVHVGAAIRARKLENLVTAIGESDLNLSLDLYLIPTDEKYLTDLKSIADVYSNVQINEPVPQDQLISIISSFDVGCVAIPPTSYNYANCLPNKFFQYIQARIPIMSGPIPEVAEIIESKSIGWVADGFGVEESKSCLNSITHEMVEGTHDFLEVAAKELSSEADNEARRFILQEIKLGRA